MFTFNCKFQLRILAHEKLCSMKPLCKEFILSEITIALRSDYKDKVMKLHDMIIGKEFEMVVLSEVRV